VSGGGSNLTTVHRRFGSAVNASSLKVPLSRAGRRHHKPFSVLVRVGFVPKHGTHSSASVRVRFRR
jgi:hypothetical protein